MFFGLNWLTSSSRKNHASRDYVGKMTTRFAGRRTEKKSKAKLCHKSTESSKGGQTSWDIDALDDGFFLFVREFENRKKLHVKKETKSWSSNALVCVILFQPGRHLLYLRLTPLNPFFMCSFNFLKVKSSSVSWRVLTSNYLPW